MSTASAPPYKPSRRRWLAVRLPWLALGLGILVTVLHLCWPQGDFADITYLLVNCGAGVGALVGWRRWRDPVARWIAIGVALSAAGDVIYQVLIWVGRGTEETSLADFGWVGSYVAVIAALLVLLRRARDWLDVDAWVDIATVTLVALLLQWQLTLSDILSDTTTPMHARLVWALYPALDAVLVALVVRTVLAKRLRHGAAAALIGGATCWLFADFLYSSSAASGSWSAWLDSGWMLGALLLAVAAWQPLTASADLRATARDTVAEDGMREYRVGRVRIAIALVPLLLPGGIEIVGSAYGFEPDPIPLFVAAVGLLGLAFVRFVHLSRASDDARALLRSRERRSSVIAAHASDASVVVDRDGLILSEAPELAALAGQPGTGTLGTDLFELVRFVGVDDMPERFARVLDTPGQVHEAELKIVRADAQELWLGVRAVNLLDDPDIGGVLVNLHDITLRKQIEDQLTYQAFHDALTGLANRSLFSDRVQQALHRNIRTGLDVAVIYLDLDGFKLVNDRLGHASGDQLLCEVSQRLRTAVRPSDTVARLGGDEFAVLLEQARGPVDEAVIVAERILGALASLIVIDGQPMTIGASLGIALGSPEATAASLLLDADIAMYRAKAAGRGRWLVHDSEMRTEATERLQLETDLLGALEGGELRLVYQPVVELATGDVVSFEGLLRWDHPTLGLVAPDRFIPIAEGNGLIIPIGAWVLDEACRQVAEWHERHPQHRDLTIAVNVSARQAASPDLVAHVATALATSGLDPSKLVLELTESALVQDPRAAAERLRELRSLGVKLAIDDFGTGYSSLSYLRQFPVDILKIDRSFISTINDQDEVPAIVRGLLDLGRTLGLVTVAEGVEDEVQRDLLRAARCDLAQGYLFSRPLDPAHAESLFAPQTPRVPATIAL